MKLLVVGLGFMLVSLTKAIRLEKSHQQNMMHRLKKTYPDCSLALI